MRRAVFMAVLGGIWLLAGRAVAMDPDGAMPPGPARICRTCGPACAASPGCSLVEGCCDRPFSCCEHVWDGYCQEKARRYARWHHAGMYGPAASTACCQ
jgi:hypothetical protein